MTVTRTQAGKTPRKTQRPDFVETPGRRSRSRTAEPRTSYPRQSTPSELDSDHTIDVNVSAAPRTQGAFPQANGHIKSSIKSHPPRIIDGWEIGTDPRIDRSGHFEFGGSWGVLALMVGFPLLMYYMWIGATCYDGKLAWPESGQSAPQFIRQMGQIVYSRAFPSARAWAIYWLFLVVQAFFYLLLPGIYAQGRPLRHADNMQLTYYCSGIWSLYTTIVIAAALHFAGVFKMYTIMDEFGPLLSVSIISGFAVSMLAFGSAVLRGATHRMSGYPIYDFFMGAELNPRMFGLLDFKMFFEVRLPWYMLLLMSLGTAARQYERYGYVTGEVGFLCMAHFLYANACSKAEECIVSTWDMYYEKWGFMLIFWNMAGVPMSYCHCIIYLANHDPSVYHWNRAALALLYVTYLFVYWVWDTSNSQKNRFKARLTGHDVQRKAFPQLPWQVVENPATIESDSGDTILVDGWYKYARKIHYTCDLFFALSWGLITGFDSPFPWFYPVFFAVMITHRAVRDIQRCRLKYGAAWIEFERRSPWLFVPYVF